MVLEVSKQIRMQPTSASVRGLMVLGIAMGLLCCFAGSAMGQYTSILSLENSGTVGSTQYTVSGVITQILSKPGAVNGIGGTGSSVVYTNAYYIQDATGGVDMYGALPSGGTYVPTVGDVVSATGQWSPYHQIPEMGSFTALSKIGTTAVPAPWVPQGIIGGQPLSGINYMLQDINLNSIPGTAAAGAGAVLPNDLGGKMLELDNVKISGAGTPGTPFGTANSPSPGAWVYDSTGGSMTFYYWPTSYSISNQNLAGVKIPSGYVNMTGFLSVYGNSNNPEFTPITITPSAGPPLFWQPDTTPGANNWDGAATCFSTTSGSRVNPTADASSSAATFDDTGLLISGGSSVNVGGGANGVSAYSVVVSNSAGTYSFSGTGSLTTTQITKNGAGTMLLNTTVVAPVSVTAGTMAGNGTIFGTLTVGSTSGPAVVTPGTNTSTIGMLTINNNVNSFSVADFSPGGTYLWKMGPSLLDNSNGTAGANWDVLNMGVVGTGGTGGGHVNFSGSAQLAISFANTAQIPSNGNSFWNSNHTWVIAGSCNNTQANFAPALGGSILNANYPGVGTFTLAGDPAFDLVLRWSSSQQASRNLLWSNGSSTSLVDGSGTWSNTGNTKWTDGTTAGLTFDSTRPDNATFGNPAGSGGFKTVTVSGAVEAGSLTFNGSNASQYVINGSSGTLTVDNGITANQTATLGVIKGLTLGYSQTWSVAAGTLSVNSNTGITQNTVAELTVTGPGMLALYCQGKYTGGTILANNAVVTDFTTGGYALPQSGVVTMAAGSQFLANGRNETVGALSGAGSINLGSGTASAAFTFGDAGNETFSGIISGNGNNGQLIYSGNGSAMLNGVNTFSGSVSVTGQAGTGELLIAADSGLGNPSNPVIVDNGNMLGAAASFGSTRSITIGPNSGVLDIIGTSSVVTLNGPINSQGTLTVNNPNGAAGTAGKLVLTNTNNSFDLSAGEVILSDGTLSVSSPACLGAAPINFLGVHDGSTLRFAGPGTYANNMSIPVVGKKAIAFDTDGNSVTLTGALSAAGNQTNFFTVDVHKTGSGSLTFACSQPGPGNIGNLFVDQGTVVFSTAAYASIPIAQNASPFGGSGGFTTISPGATLQLANAQLGLNADSATNGVSLPTISLYSGSGAATSVSGATLLGSGTSSYNNGGLEVRLNYSGTATINNLGNLSNYGSGSATIGTVNAGDVLSIGSAIRQLDAGSSAAFGVGNYGGNAIKSGPTTYADDANKLVTIHVTGPGVVRLQSGAVTSNSTFGGDWSVDSGVLEVGPYQVSTNVWNGPYGQLFNALGFKTLDGQTTGTSGTEAVNGDPDMPNGVTVHNGGMFAVAADQINYTWHSSGLNNTLSGSGEFGVNGTPNYFRNPITLNGGTLAASGKEVIMSLDSGTLPILSGTTAVTAMLGGNFTVTAGTSTIATFDPLGTGARTVQLLGGSRTLSNSTAAYAAGATITYSTSWGGTLKVDGGTAGGGEFDLFRNPGGSISVAAGAGINILHGATVKLGGTEPNLALYDNGSHNTVNFTAGAGGGHLVVNRADTVTYRGDISGAIDLTNSGAGTLILTGTNDYIGGTYVDNGTIQVNSSSSLPDNGNLWVGANARSLLPEAVVPGGIAGATAVPEPSSIALLISATGCGALIVWRRRVRQGCAAPRTAAVSA
jgi:autotransporter-associated beta strand protein